MLHTYSIDDACCNELVYNSTYIVNWDHGIPNCLFEIVLLDILLFYVRFILFRSWCFVYSTRG